MKNNVDETQNFKLSSRPLEFGRISTNLGKNKKTISKNDGFAQKFTLYNNPKKNTNQYLSLYPRAKTKYKNTHIKNKYDKEFIEKNEREIKNSFISMNTPLRMTGNWVKNTMFLHKNRNTIADPQYMLVKRNSIQIDFPKRRNSKKGLKQIQLDLQFKLLDMSYQIENDSETKQETMEQAPKLKRKENKRNTEYSNRNRKSNCVKLKTTKTVEKKMNNNLFLIQNKVSAELTKNKIPTPKNNNRPDKKLLSGRRQSYIPKSNLSNKFVNNNLNNLNQNRARLNLSVNMDLYRDLIPKLDLDIGDGRATTINNKSMLISKENVNIKKILLHSLKNEQFENKYRLIMRNKELYDSYEDEEVIEEPEDELFFISPETYGILFLDTLILFCTLFGSLYIPIYISQSKCFCSYMPKAIEYILFFHEGINIIDIIISFFRAYYNFEFVLIKKNEKIVVHYLTSYFILDLLSAIPFFSLSYYSCNYYENKPDGAICLYNGVDLKNNFIKMLLGLKMVKLFKVLNKKVNRGINYFNEVISENYTLEKTMNMVLFTILCIIGFNFFICYHIYIGLQSYPNWILKTNLQDSSFITLYITSFYFLITTITSVGYGDITCISLSETFYQIIILTIGVVAYSWIVSTIGNYVKKETRAAIKFNKDVSLLEEIRVSYPKMSFKLYNKIHKHLETVSHQQEKLDTNLLVTNLPYTLKNQIMSIIYGSVITKFKFFKECENSDFILRVLTSYIPLSTKKGAFIIQEGEIIDNIIFVKEGRLSLVATIDLDNPLLSIDNYLGEKFEDINEKMNTKLDNSIHERNITSTIKKEQATSVLKTFLKTKELEEENIEQEMAKKDFNDEIEIGNLQFLNVLDILKNEHYGIVYMFLKKPAPLSLRVKSKYCQLFLLRKNDAMQISKAYPNVWKKIYYKSYHNMKSIKKLTKKIVINYCKHYGHKYNSEIIEENNNAKQEVDFLLNIGLLNSRKRKSNMDNKIASDISLPKTKSILKNKNSDDNHTGSMNQKLMSKYKSFKTGNYTNKYMGLQMTNTLAVQKGRASTNINQNNLYLMPGLSSLTNDDQVVNTRVNQINQYNQINHINQINNNINYNIVINDHDNNNDSKTLLNSEDNKNKQFITNSIKNFQNINTFDIDQITRANFNQNSGIINNFSSLRPDNINSNVNINITKPAIKEAKTIKMTSTKNNIERNNTLEMKNSKVNSSENSEDTICDLSKSLLKKVKKKIKKRNKKKKLYKKFLQKITETLIKVNPNTSFATNINNNTVIFSSKVGDMLSINPEYTDYKGIIDETPELNPSISQTINPNPSQNMMSNEIMNSSNMHQGYEPRGLFIIPEGVELSSSESSSDNSSDSDDSKSKEKEKSSEETNNNNKISNDIAPKKEIELSISENNNFTLNTTYENLNKLSEGNYSKDENLQKSVHKIIQVYLEEKTKKENEQKQISSQENNSISKSPKIKDLGKEKKEKEKDVWSFLDDDDDDKDDSKNNENSKTKDKDDFEKKHSKSPKIRHKKMNDITKKKKHKSVYDNLFSLDDFSKNKKTFKKKNRKKSINKTSIKKDINKRKSRKKITKNENIINLKETQIDKGTEEKNKKEKEEKNDNEEEEKNSFKEKDNILNSLEFSDLDEEIAHKENFKNNFKTYQNKSQDGNLDDNSSANNNSLSSKDKDNN